MIEKKNERNERYIQSLTSSVSAVDSFGISLLPTVFTWHQHNWSFQSKSSVQQTFGESWWLAFVRPKL